MSNIKLKNKKVAILVTNGFEESELTEPRKALTDNGAITHIISLQSGTIKSWKNGNWGMDIKVDKTIDEVNEMDYNALLLPGGVINPDTLRQNELAVKFVRSFFKNQKPVAAICHGPQLLIEADVVDGRMLTSYPSIRKDLLNAGAEWLNQEVVVDQGLVTSRSPKDLPAFNSKLVEEVAEGRHARQTA